MTPIYNRAEQLKGLISGLNSQTEKNFEAIMVDDGSTDNSVKELRKMKTVFPMRIIRQKNSGPAVARNKGAKNAKAEIIVFLDSDCDPRSDFLEKLIEPFENPEVVGVQAETETKNVHSLIARYVSCEIYYRHEHMKKRKYIDHISTCACAYRKKDFGKGFLTHFRKADMEDIEFSYRLSKRGKKLVFQPSSRVKHEHPEKFWKFLKLQFSRGYWRVPGHKLHPDKMFNDSYLGKEMLVQGAISLLFIISPLLGLMSLFTPWKFLVVFPFLVFILLFLSNIPFGVYSSQYEKKMIVFAPLMASLRSIMATLGFVSAKVSYKE